MRKLIFLLLASGTILYTACTEEDMLVLSAPCAWEIEFSAVPDTCFELPDNPNGSVFTAPYEVDYSYYSPIFDPLTDGSFYYVKVDQPHRDEVTLVRKSLCADAMSTTQIMNTNGGGKIKINQAGNLIYIADSRNVVYYDASNDTVDTLLQDPNLVIDLFWINDSTYAAHVYIEDLNEGRYIAYNTNGFPLDTLPIGFANTSNQNDLYFAWHYSPGPLRIYSTETFDLVKTIPRPEDFRGAIRTTWIDNERLLLLETKKLSLLNIETEDETVLLDYSTCENIGFFSVTSDPFNHDHVLISRFDHYYDENGQIYRHERISYYNIATGEERILELE